MTLVSISEEGDVKTAARRFRFELERGNAVICPCCKRKGEMVRRNIHKTMASSLVWLVGEYRRSRDWVYIPDTAPSWVVKAREWGRMRYWGMVEPQFNVDPSKRTSGVWRPTQLGEDFADGFVRVPKYVFIFNDTIIERSGDLIHIKDAFDDQFNYQELINGGRD